VGYSRSIRPNIRPLQTPVVIIVYSYTSQQHVLHCCTQHYYW
jgi:hypothetical protein